MPLVIGYLCMKTALNFLAEREIVHGTNPEAIPGVAFISLGVDPWLAALLDDAIEAEVLTAIRTQVLEKETNTCKFLSMVRVGLEHRDLQFKRNFNAMVNGLQNDGDVQTSLLAFYNHLSPDDKATFNRVFPQTGSGPRFEKPSGFELFVKQYMRFEAADTKGAGLAEFKVNFHAWVDQMLVDNIALHTFHKPLKIAGEKMHPWHKRAMTDKEKHYTVKQQLRRKKIPNR
jgi:hypothetical protein